MFSPSSLLLITLLALPSAHAPVPQPASGIAAKSSTAAVPGSLAQPIASRLGTDSVHVEIPNGSVALDFWWVEALPIGGSAAAPSWADVEEGTLVGAVNVSAAFRDIRGRVIKPGVYTLRFGIQPDNGDHLGVSPYREFLLLSPAAVDTDPAPTGHDGTIEMSTQTIGGSHPAVWSLDPPVARAEPLSVVQTDLGHHAVVMEVPTAREGKPAGALRFGLVLVGRIEA